MYKNVEQWYTNQDISWLALLSDNLQLGDQLLSLLDLSHSIIDELIN